MPVVNGVRLVSNSEVQTFKACRRKWWLTYHRALTSRQTEFSGIRSIGTRLHLALSAYYTPGYTDSVNPLEAHVKAAEEDMAAYLANAEERGFVADTAPLLRDFSLERIMLEGYMQWLEETGADSDLEIISSEQYMEAELKPGVKIIGKIDARTRSRTTGRRKFIDHKSVQVFVKPQLLRQNEQFLHYELLESLSGETERCDGAFYNQLRRVKRTATAKPPFYKRETVEHNRYELDSYLKRLRGTIREIELTEKRLEQGIDPLFLVPPTPTQDCDWKCPFVKVCPLFDDGSRVEAALESQFVQHDPLSYYGEREED
jgi:PD-(D/E)XK nuclease superfamily protein